MSLDGKVTLVTGSSRGIGRAAAVALARAGPSGRVAKGSSIAAQGEPC